METQKYSISDMSLNEIHMFMGKLNEEKNERLKNKSTSQSFIEEYHKYSGIHHSVKYQKSINNAFKHFNEFFGDDVLLTEMGVRQVELFIQSLIKKVPKGFRVYYRNLKAAFNKAVDWEYLTLNPFLKIKLPKRQNLHPFFIDRMDLGLVIDASKNKMLAAIYLFAFLTGCRLSEVTNIKWEDLDLDRNLITVGTQDFTTKSREQRIIPICENLNRYLKEMFVDWKNLTGFLFVKENNYPYSSDYVSKQFKKSVRLAGLDERIHFHTLRHSFASQLVQKQVPIYTVQKLLGHSSVTTTEIYAHIDTNELKNAINKLNS